MGSPAGACATRFCRQTPLPSVWLGTSLLPLSLHSCPDGGCLFNFQCVKHEWKNSLRTRFILGLAQESSSEFSRSLQMGPVMCSHHCAPAVHVGGVGSCRPSLSSGPLLLQWAVSWTVLDFGLVKEEEPGKVKEPERFQIVVVTTCARWWFPCCSKPNKEAKDCCVQKGQ